MKPQRIIFVRYGDTEANDNPVMYCCVPYWRITLIKLGIAQEKRSGEEDSGVNRW